MPATRTAQALRVVKICIRQQAEEIGTGPTVARRSRPLSPAGQPERGRAPFRGGPDVAVATEETAVTASQIDDIDVGDTTTLEPLAERIPMPPAPAKRAARARLTDRLTSLGITAGAAMVIARATVDPTGLRNRLADPLLHRVHGGGALIMAQTDLYAAAVAPGTGNPRESGERPLPIEGPGSPVLPRLRLDPATPLELVQPVPNRELLATAQQESARVLLRENNYSDDIAASGVLVPVAVHVQRLDHQDGTPTVWSIVGGDGNSRITSCHSLLGVTGAEAVYTYSQDDRRLHSLIGEWRARWDAYSRGETPPPHAVRALIIPANIVIAVADTDLLSGVQAYVALQHVEHPTVWSKTAKADAVADAALTEMEAVGLPRHHADWFSGRITQAEATGHGLSPHLDERALATVSALRLRRDSASRGARRVTRQASTKAKGMAGIAADLALRPVRTEMRDPRRPNEVDVRRDEYAGIIEAVWSVGWSEPVPDVEALRDQALSELEAGSAGFGPAQATLLVLGGFTLIRRDIVNNLQHAKGADRRFSHDVILELARSRQGIHQLARTVLDERSGIAPRSVDADGALVRSAGTGLPVALDNAIVRTVIAPQPITTDPVSEAPKAEDTPRSQLDKRRTAVYTGARAALDNVEAISTLRDEAGLLLINSEGWPPAAAGEIIDALEKVLRRVIAWQALAAAASEAGA